MPATDNDATTWQMGGRAGEGQQALPLGAAAEAPVPSSSVEDSGGAGSTDASPASEAPSFAVALLGMGTLRGLGRRGIRAIVEAYQGDLSNLVSHPDAERLRFALRRSKTPAAETLATTLVSRMDALLAAGMQQVEKLQKDGVVLLSWKQLPLRLGQLPDGPRWLFVEGNPAALQSRVVAAVVGTREASGEGREAARRVVRLLAAYPVTIVSGLAEGIDEEVHRASLSLGVPNVAFLGHGITTVFPAATADIRTEIVASGGAVATEYLPTERYGRQNFVERNRLQAGLANVVIPVEGGSKSGTAHTVRFAQRYGRTVLGTSWGEARGIAKDLMNNGTPVFDLDSPSGAKAMDAALRETISQLGEAGFPLSLPLDELRQELLIRNVTDAEWEKFLERANRMRGVDK